MRNELKTLDSEPTAWRGTTSLQSKIAQFFTPARRQILWRQHLLPILLFLLLAVLVTFPLVLGFGDHVIGDDGDAWQNIWNYWWTKQALLGLHNPYFTPLLYAPYGASLYLHSLNLFNGLVSLPVQLLFGPIAAYNFVVLFSLTFAGYFSYLLFGQLLGSRKIGFVGGVLYAFGSFELNQLYLGQANLFASEWLPGYLVCLVASEKSRGRRRILWVGLGALCLVCAMLCDLQFIILAALFTLAYLPYACLTRRSWWPLINAAAMGLLWLLVSAPLMLKTSSQINNFILSQSGASFTRAYSADLLSFFVPDPRQWLLGGWAKSVASVAIAPTYNRDIFVGYFTLLLGLVGLWWGRWRSLYWWGVAFVFGLLALGPLLQVNGQLHAEVGLPFDWLQSLPGISVIRVPARFGLLVSLALIMPVGLALAGLARKLPTRWGSRTRIGLTALAVVLLLAEHLTVPFPAVQAPTEPFYRQLGASGQSGAVLELLYSKNSPQALYSQTLHQHPIVGGYLSRQLDYSLPDLPPMTTMPDVQGKDIVLTAMNESELAAQAMRFAGVRWLVFLLQVPPLQTADVPMLAGRYADGGPIYRDNQMAVYLAKQPTQSGPAYFLDVKGGWYAPERSTAAQDKAGWVRWFERRGGMYAWSFSPQTQAAVLEFDTWSFQQPRHLTLRVDNKDVATWLINARQHLSLPLTLTPGRHQIEWRAFQEEPTSPAAAGLGNDQRPLSLAVTNVELK